MRLRSDSLVAHMSSRLCATSSSRAKRKRGGSSFLAFHLQLTGRTTPILRTPFSASRPSLVLSYHFWTSPQEGSNGQTAVERGGCGWLVVLPRSTAAAPLSTVSSYNVNPSGSCLHLWSKGRSTGKCNSQFLCIYFLSGICSHSRSYEYFAESISSGGFLAVPCDAYSDFEKDLCANNSVGYMGDETKT